MRFSKKGTPGPWFVSKCGGHSGLYVESEANGWTVAEVLNAGDEGEEGAIGDANARLIAFAPALVEALRGFVAANMTTPSVRRDRHLGKAEAYARLVLREAGVE